MPVPPLRTSHLTFVAGVLAGTIASPAAAQQPATAQQPAAAQQLCFPEAVDIPEVEVPVPEPVLAGDGEQRLVINAGRINLVDENRVEFDEQVAFRYGERSISAERASFDLQTETAEVNGTVAYRDGQVTIYGEQAEVDTRGQIITFEAGGFELPLRGAQGAAEAIQIRGDKTIGLRSVSFTTCVNNPPDWELLARDLEMDIEAGSGTARGFRLRFKGVPVLGSPFVTFPLDERRKSGVLTPTFSNRDRTGMDIALPVYINLAPNYDLTFTTRYMRERGALADTEFRYLLPGTTGQLRFEYLPEDAKLGITRNHFSFRNDTRLGEALQLVADVQEISDFFYFEDMHNSLSVASQTHLNRAVQVSFRAPRWSLLGQVQDIQTIDPFIGPGFEPYRRMPQFLFRGDWANRLVRLDSRSELVRFDRRIGVTGWRFDLEEELSLQFRRPGMFLTPAVALRQTNYWLDEESVDRFGLGSRETEISRTLPVASLDAGLTFERTAPRPRLDTDHRAAGAVRARAVRGAVAPAGIRYRGADVQFRAVVPQVPLPGRRPDRRHGSAQCRRDHPADRWPDRPRKACRHPRPDPLPEPPAGDDASQVHRPGERLGLYRRGRDESATVVAAGCGLPMGQPGGRNLAHRGAVRVSPPGRPDAGLRLPLPGGRPGTGRHRRGVADRQRLEDRRPGQLLFPGRKPLERFLGWEYTSCCWRLQVYGRDYISRRTGESDRSLTVQFLLRGFTDPGDSAESMLERGILGYRRFDDLR